MMSMNLGVRSSFKLERPVVLPPGRARLATRPLPTGSLMWSMTIGTAVVARCAALIAAMVLAIMTLGLR